MFVGRATGSSVVVCYSVLGTGKESGWSKHCSSDSSRECACGLWDADGAGRACVVELGERGMCGSMWLWAATGDVGHCCAQGPPLAYLVDMQSEGRLPTDAMLRCD